MNNFVQLGDNITLPSPNDVKSGEGALIGSIFGVASTAAKLGEDCAFVRIGVFNLPKQATQAWTSGQKVYFDPAAKLVTNVAAGGVLIGAAAGAVGAGAAETSGAVLLTGQVS